MSRFLALLVMIATAAALFWLTGCATDTGDMAKDRRGRVANQLMIEAGRVLGKVALDSLKNVVTAELQGTSIDWGHTAADAAWSVTASVDSGTLQRVINAATQGRTQATAAIASQQFRAAVSSGVPPDKAAFAIGDVISGTALKMDAASIP